MSARMFQKIFDPRICFGLVHPETLQIVIVVLKLAERAIYPTGSEMGTMARNVPLKRLRWILLIVVGVAVVVADVVADLLDEEEAEGDDTFHWH